MSRTFNLLVLASVACSLASLVGCGAPQSDEQSPAESVVSPLTAGSLLIQAESYASQLNVTRYGAGIANVDDGDWVRYAGVNLGAAGTYGKFVARLGTPYGGNHIEVRLDSLTGPLVADLVTAATGGFASPLEQTTVLTSAVSGVHDVYVRFDGATNRAACQQNCWTTTTPQCPAAKQNGCGFGVGNIDWFAFSPADPTTITLTVSPTPNLVAFQPAIFIASVTTGGGTPVTVGSVLLGGVPGVVQTPPGVALDGLGQTWTTAMLPAGSYPVTATYSGSVAAGLAGSTVTTVINVAKADTVMTPTITPNPIPFDAPSTYGGTLTVVAPSNPSGLGPFNWAWFSCAHNGVPFVCGGPMPADVIGQNTLTITFLGDANYNSSTGSVIYERLPSTSVQSNPLYMPPPGTPNPLYQ